MPVGVKRIRVLLGMGDKRGTVHRYTWWRWAVAIVSTVAVALLPLTGVLRIDLWAGHHMWLGEPVGTVAAAKAFAFPFLAVNIAIIVASRFLGRWLCGFGCPIGNMNRLAEWFQWRGRKGWKRFFRTLPVLAACMLLAAITFSFWVDWRVFAEGSPRAVTAASVFLFGMGLGFFALVQGLGMRFCREYCPSGVYFALLGPETRTGIEFANPDACTDCHACENVCPVDLKPREMASAEERPGMGFYPDGMTNYANCLRCGDCVVVCEDTTGKNGTPTPLVLGLLSPAAVRAGSEDESAPVD